MGTFSGTFTAMITPMTKDGKVDFEVLSRHTKFELEAGIDGLAPLGTTAETPTLTEAEELEIAKIIFSERDSYFSKTSRRVPIILGAGSNNTRDAIRYCTRAAEFGADAALVVTPYYNKPSQEGIFLHFKEVSKVGIPIFVYNIAGRTGVNIETQTLMRIAELPNIAGVKEASGNVNQMMDVIAKIKNQKPDFTVFSGDDSLTLPLLALGGDGVISVVSNLFPKFVKALTDAAKRKDFCAAKKIHFELLPIFRAAFCDGNPSSIKYAMSLKGFCEPFVRSPLCTVNSEAKKILEKAVLDCEKITA